MTDKDTSNDDYERDLPRLQLALVRYQQHAIATGDKVLIIFEGRDAAGKDGSIHRITEHLSSRATRVVAPPKPSDREKSQWFFQRYVPWLPAAGETVIFNRSWYNRGGVEPVMGFCTEEQVDGCARGFGPFTQERIGHTLRWHSHPDVRSTDQCHIKLCAYMAGCHIEVFTLPQNAST